VPARAVAATAFFCGVGAAAVLSLDSQTRTALEMDYHAQNEQWAEVLRVAGRLPKGRNNQRCNRNIIQALYHTGRLGDEMFRYPQRSLDFLANSPQHDSSGSSYFQESRLFLDVGQVNLAEQSGYEALAISGQHPAILEQLAIIHVAKGQPETARVFLNALAKHLFHGRTARDMLRRLDADPALENDPRVSRIRENLTSKDSIAQATSLENLLQILLEKNPHNKMAFELLMACYLIERKPERVRASLARLKDFSYARVPRHYQEAVALVDLSDARISRPHPEEAQETPSAGRAPPPPGFEIDREVRRRADDFARIMVSAASPEEAVKAALDAGLGDSYFFYFTWGFSRG
jgi:hypothetical protein